MRIAYQPQGRFFHLKTNEMSYAMGVAPDGRLLHLYWGAPLSEDASLEPLAREKLVPYRPSAGVDLNAEAAFELPAHEPGDYGEPVLRVIHSDGVRSLRLVYCGHRLEDAQHLVITLRDTVYPFEAELHYKGWDDLPILSRWVTVCNSSDAPVTLSVIKSAAWHLPDGYEYRLTHLSGNWGAEYSYNELMLTQARTVLQNTRLTCAAAQQTPFFALDQDGAATETDGELYFGLLHWSGDFAITIERQYQRRVCVAGGINDEDCEYVLRPGERFETPMFTAGFVSHGFARMSEALYDWQLDRLCPRGQKISKAYAERPVIYNSWYPYEFDVREDRCLSLIEKCGELGVELFVLDDGWMPGRVNDHTGLGDWRPDEKRFPHGLTPLSAACHERGMLFGLWVEPEMVNPDSDLYRAHPDWVIREPTRPQTLQRNQLVLNLAMDEVRDWAIGWLDDLIQRCQLDYLKWDMNRYGTENGWPDVEPEMRRSLPIRYTRNLMAIWKHLNEKFPDVLFENCASGGGRADFGMVPYADRINRSDNADPVDVMLLHEGFTMLFIPKTAGGAGNIAPATHAIHGRTTPLEFRIHWGMTGSMSIGMNLLTATPGELDALKQAVADFKLRRRDLQDAYVYRLASARHGPYAVFQYVRRDRRAFTLFAFAHGLRASDLHPPRFRMRGLLPQAVYTCEDGTRATGEALMNIGVSVSLKGDYASLMKEWHIKT